MKFFEEIVFVFAISSCQKNSRNFEIWGKIAKKKKQKKNVKISLSPQKNFFI